MKIEYNEKGDELIQLPDVYEYFLRDKHKFTPEGLEDFELSVKTYKMVWDSIVGIVDGEVHFLNRVLTDFKNQLIEGIRNPNKNMPLDMLGMSYMYYHLSKHVNADDLREVFIENSDRFVSQAMVNNNLN